MVFPWVAAAIVASAALSARSSSKASKRAQKGSSGGKHGKGGQYVDPLRKSQQQTIDKFLKGFPSHKLGFEHKGLYKRGYGYLKDLYSDDPKAMEAFQKPYLRQFRQEVVPEITQRYSEFGEGGLQSSGFQNALAQASQGLQENLASMRSGMQMQALPQSLNYLQGPVQSYYNKAALAMGGPGQNYIPNAPQQPGFWSNVGGGIGQGVGQIGSAYIANKLMNMGGEGGTPAYGSTKWGYSNI